MRRLLSSGLCLIGVVALLLGVRIYAKALVAQHRQALCSEGFVGFDEVEIRRFPAGFFQGGLRSGDGA